MEKAEKEIKAYALAGSQVRLEFFEKHSPALIEAGKQAAIILARGGKILFCGNGGSAADAQHLAAELINRFEMERPGLNALALSTDTSALTAISNDYGFEQIFEKQVKAMGQAGDMLVGISTSGRSPNVVRALKAAKNQEMITIGLCGRNGDEMQEFCDILLPVPADRTAIIQEVHIAAGHMFCHLIDYFLFEAVAEIQPWL